MTKDSTTFSVNRKDWGDLCDRVADNKGICESLIQDVVALGKYINANPEWLESVGKKIAEETEETEETEEEEEEA